MLFHNYIKDWTNRIANDVACPHWSQTEGCHRDNQATNGESLVPCGIGKREIVWIGYFLEQDLAYNTQDIDCGHNY